MGIATTGHVSPHPGFELGTSRVLILSRSLTHHGQALHRHHELQNKLDWWVYHGWSAVLFTLMEPASSGTTALGMTLSVLCTTGTSSTDLAFTVFLSWDVIWTRLASLSPKKMAAQTISGCELHGPKTSTVVMSWFSQNTSPITILDMIMHGFTCKTKRQIRLGLIYGCLRQIKELER